MATIKFEQLDDQGLDNLMLSIVEQARKDYIKGWKAMKRVFGRIFSEKEFDEWYKTHHKANKEFIDTCRNHYSAISFLEKDPYYLFGEKQNKILEAWNELAKDEYEHSYAES